MSIIFKKANNSKLRCLFTQLPNTTPVKMLRAAKRVVVPWRL